MSNEILSDLLLEYDQKKRKAELDLENVNKNFMKKFLDSKKLKIL